MISAGDCNLGTKDYTDPAVSSYSTLYIHSLFLYIGYVYSQHASSIHICGSE